MANQDFPTPPPQPARNTESAAPPKPVEGYSDDEARDIYARAAEIQSETLFQDEKMTPEMLASSARRAGIDDAAVKKAIQEREAEQKAQQVREAERVKQSAKTRQRVIYGVVGFVAVSGLTCLVAQSSLGSRSATVAATRSQVDNVLERRHNLIPNLISVTKSTLDNQKALTDALRAANEAASKARTPDEKVDAEANLDSTISQTVTALQSNENSASPVVMNLVTEMAGAENRISVERRKYNLAAAEYNRVAGSFPVGLAGRLIGYPSSYKLFEASAESRETPKFEN